MPTDLGPRLRAVREALGLSQERAAALAGTSQSAISHAEAGRRTVTVQWVLDYAAAIGADPHAIDERLASPKPPRRQRPQVRTGTVATEPDE